MTLANIFLVPSFDSLGDGGQNNKLLLETGFLILQETSPFWFVLE